jgi:hypothetical protein
VLALVNKKTRVSFGEAWRSLQISSIRTMVSKVKMTWLTYFKVIRDL